jgi:hypothetical protein
LLAAESLRVEKIQENRFVGLSSGFLGLGQITQPANLHGHKNRSFSVKAALFMERFSEFAIN